MRTLGAAHPSLTCAQHARMRADQRYTLLIVRQIGKIERTRPVPSSFWTNRHHRIDPEADGLGVFLQARRDLNVFEVGEPKDRPPFDRLKAKPSPEWEEVAAGMAVHLGEVLPPAVPQRGPHQLKSKRCPAILFSHGQAFELGETAEVAQPNAARRVAIDRAEELARAKIVSVKLLVIEVKSMRATKAPELLREAQARHSASCLSPEQWDAFLLVYKGDVDKALADYVVWVDQKIAEINGVPPPPGAPDTPLIAEDTDLATVKLATLNAEMARLAQLISADQLVRNQYIAVSTRIAQENSALQAIEARHVDAQGAAERRKALQTERDAAYGRVFDAIVSEQNALASLYAPLMAQLAAASGTLKKLSFSVSRLVDADAWGNVAEDALIDCRKSGPFFGRGSLIKVANADLKPAWTTGSAADVQAVMTNFIATYTRDLFAHAPFVPTQQAEFRTWSKRFAHWLFSTDHIAVRYEIAYDGVDIRKLSPGTRGIVLLLLYLALDDADDRPLIIDQPEENLDPKSVFDELVDLFIQAKAKRQVIMVTHNANLVINTDADQIIVAQSGAHESGGLPPISYTSGGLEDFEIRKAVCNILEGGEDAFRERARRLRVRLER